MQKNNWKRALGKVSLGLSAFGIALSSAHASTETTFSIKQQIGQKMMLDFRYFCEQPVPEGEHCRKPMTSLPAPLAKLVKDYDLGGVILFAENVQGVSQVVHLNQQLQAAAKQSALGLPMFISVDQEGGRVARIPRDVGTTMTGNMSIGATYEQYGTEFATDAASVIGKELHVLGFNVNYAPSVDVNMNPQNPVINVRSFGEDPKRVAALGAATVKGLQQQNMIAALKHFPGHGDTATDSHTGLPRVAHSRQEVMAKDVYPFKHIIEQGAEPGMVMTAHIQYPALDSSTYVNKAGEEMMKPATMSRAIMTDLLRGEMGYKGVTITDALDMAGISHFFEPIDAVLNVYEAGVDIALMPIAIRTEQDVAKFEQMVAAVEQALEKGELDKAEFAQSAQRILDLKAKYELESRYQDADLQTTVANVVVGNQAHRIVESELALAAITDLKNAKAAPNMISNASAITLLMPDTRKCTALEQALSEQLASQPEFTCISLRSFEPAIAKQAINEANVVISANSASTHSAVEVGGMDDLADGGTVKVSFKQRPAMLEQLMKLAQQSNKPQIFISLHTPYDSARFAPYADVALASYAYNIDQDDGEHLKGPAYTALAKVLTGKGKALGKSPVSI